MNRPDIKAVIFDVDGLMLNTEEVGRRAWKAAGREWGYTIPESAYQEVVGRTVKDSRQIFRQIFGEDFPFDDIRQRRLDLAGEHYRQHGVPVKSGLIKLLTFLEERNIPKAVATSTYRDQALLKLGSTGLRERFEAIVTGDEIENGKPAPDIFLTAAARLNMPARHCLVLEDSEPGILAAHAAGMLAIMVPDLKQPSESVQQQAYRVAKSLHEVREILLQDILNTPGKGTHKV